MTCTPAALVKGGSAIGVLITDRSPELCGDALIVRFQNGESESSIRRSVRNFSGITQFAHSETSQLFAAF
jgi:hypothetical protein